jgi:hypothetical protein
VGEWTRRKRIEALQRGRDRWGCGGTHKGRGPKGLCPPYEHHHHDDFCALPTAEELEEAGVKMPVHGWYSRAGA